MTINYDFQTGPHDWERYEYEVDYSDIRDFVEHYYTDEEVADLYISELYRDNEKNKEEFKKELDINDEDELKQYMLTYGGLDWAIDELVDVCGIEIFDLADSAHRASLQDYFEDDAFEQYQDSLDLADNDEWIATKSRYW